MMGRSANIVHERSAKENGSVNAETVCYAKKFEEYKKEKRIIATIRETTLLFMLEMGMITDALSEDEQKIVAKYEGEGLWEAYERREAVKERLDIPGATDKVLQQLKTFNDHRGRVDVQAVVEERLDIMRQARNFDERFVFDN